MNVVGELPLVAQGEGVERGWGGSGRWKSLFPKLSQLQCLMEQHLFRQPSAHCESSILAWSNIRNQLGQLVFYALKCYFKLPIVANIILPNLCNF